MNRNHYRLTGKEKLQIKIRTQTEENCKRLLSIFRENPTIYQNAYVLAEKMRVRACTVRRLVRLLRLRNIGILPGKNGYILSKYAKQSDDLYFIRRCYGHRANDYITLQAAKPDIDRRWNTIEGKKHIALLVDSLMMENTDKISLVKNLLNEKDEKIKA
jgi:hypothetical protein